MAKLTREEREEKKRLLTEKREARRLVKEKKDAEKAKQQSSTGASASASASASTSSSNVRTLPTVERNKAAQPSAGKEDHDRDRDCPFLNMAEDAMHQVLCFLSAKDLGAAIMSCRALNAMLAEARVPILISRLNRPNMPLLGGVGYMQLCQDQAEARTIIQQSFAGGDTGRILPKKIKINPIPHVAGAANEFVGYVRFVEQAISGHATLRGDTNRANPTLLPPCVNGRFASVSPEHSLCRMGGDGSNCGPGGSGVVSWGVGKRGQLGHGKRQDQTTPKMLLGGIGYSNRIRIVQVSAGGGLVRVAHSLLLTSTGRVLSFGTAQYGALGHGYSPGKQLPDETRPRYIDGLSRVTCTCVSAGELHSAVTTSDGDVYSWGDGFCGQLGLGDKRPQLTPQQVTLGGLEDEPVASVACGNRHTICVTDDGEVFTFGLGHFGVLGRSYTPFEYDADAAVIALHGDDAGVGVGAPQGQQQGPPLAIVPLLDDAELPGIVAAVAAADAGNDNNGDALNRMSEETMVQLDLLARLTLDDNSNKCIPMVVDSLQDIKIVGASAGHRHSIVLDSQGGIYTFGAGAFGALGHGDFTLQCYPMKVMELVNEDVKIIQISAGVDMSMAVSTTGDVYAWGKTDGGRLGLRSTCEHGNIPIPRRVYLDDSHGETLKAVDVECGYVHSIIIGLNGTIHQCGGVGTHGDDDGQRGTQRGTAQQGEDTLDGRPVQVADCNIWHRIPEPKKDVVKKEKWKKYGTYELKGRSSMMSETDKWNN